MITSAGAVKLEKSRYSIILANDDVNIHFPHDTVVVSDGSIMSKSSSCDVLIARKDVVVCGGFLSAQGNIVLGISGSHLNTGGRVRIENIGKGWVSKTEVNEGQAKPLGVRFFEPADLGIEPSAINGGVKVEKVSSGLPPAKAGLQVGDVILTVDGKKSADVETLRRQLRRAFVQDEATIIVRRGDKEIELTIDFFGFDLSKRK